MCVPPGENSFEPDRGQLQVLSLQVLLSSVEHRRNHSRKLEFNVYNPLYFPNVGQLNIPKIESNNPEISRFQGSISENDGIPRGPGWGRD